HDLHPFSPLPERLFDFALHHVAAQADIAQLRLAQVGEFVALPRPANPGAEQNEKVSGPPRCGTYPRGNGRAGLKPGRSKLSGGHHRLIWFLVLRPQSCASTIFGAIETLSSVQ